MDADMWGQFCKVALVSLTAGLFALKAQQHKPVQSSREYVDLLIRSFPWETVTEASSLRHAGDLTQVNKG